MRIFWFLPILFQAIAIAVDELYFHRQRKLPAWERRGHPIDTLGVAACVLVAAAFPFETQAFHMYVALSIFSMLIVTKDEWVHAERCGGGELWVHAVLFLLHPLVLISVGFFWWCGATSVLRAFLVLLIAYALYQFFYWNVVRKTVDAETN